MSYYRADVHHAENREMPETREQPPNDSAPRVERWDVIDSEGQTVARRLDAFAADLRCATLNKYGNDIGGPLFKGPFRVVRLVELREGERLERTPAVPDAGLVGTPERDLRVIAARINADVASGQVRHLTYWCVRRLTDIATAIAP